MTNSPTFVACFADGETTRLTTYAAAGKQNLARGVRLARAAYESRTRRTPPAITDAHYESVEGKIIEAYTRELLDAVP